MTAVNATTARQNLYQLIAEVNRSSIPVVITNNRGKNAVLLSIFFVTLKISFWQK